MHLVSDFFDDNTAWNHAIRNHCYYGFAPLHVYYPLWPIYQVGVETFFTREGVRIFMTTFQMIIIYFFKSFSLEIYKIKNFSYVIILACTYIQPPLPENIYK